MSYYYQHDDPQFTQGHANEYYKVSDPGYKVPPAAIVTEYTPSPPPQRTRPTKLPDYVPLTVRLWFVATLLVITVLLAGTIEILLRRLPTELDLRYPNNTIYHAPAIRVRSPQIVTESIPFDTGDSITSDIPPSDQSSGTFTPTFVGTQEPTDFAEQRTTNLMPTEPVFSPEPIDFAEQRTTDLNEQGTPTEPPPDGTGAPAPTDFADQRTTDLFDQPQTTDILGLGTIDPLLTPTPTPTPATTESGFDNYPADTVYNDGRLTTLYTGNGGAMVTTIGSTTTKRRVYPTGVPSEFSAGYSEKDLPVYTPGNFTDFHYFVGQYGATLAAILFGLVWISIYVELLHLEPFYQISRPGGALLGSTLCHTYLNKLSLAVPLISLWNQHWAVVFGSIASVFSVMVLPPFASAFFKVEVPDLCWDELLTRNGDQIPYCYRSLLVVKWPARVAQIILAMIAFFGVILLLVLWRRGKFLYGPVTSIIGVAVLSQNSSFLEEMRLQSSGHAEGRLPEMSCQLKFIPANDINSDPSYSIVFVNKHTSGWASYAANLAKMMPFWRRNDDAYEYRQGSQRKVALRVWLMCVFWVYLAILFSLIVVYRFSKSFLDDFLDGDKWEIKLLVTFLAGIAQLFWGVVSRDVQAIAPYQTLSGLNARPESSILLSYVHTVPGWTSTRALLRGDFLVFLSSTATLFAEILTVAIPAVPYTRSQSLKDSIYIGYIAVALSGLMLLILTILIIMASRMRFAGQPNTVAGLISYLCQSNMIASLEGLSTSSRTEVKKAITNLKRKYGLGYSVGPDGIERHVIDEAGYINRGLTGKS